MQVELNRKQIRIICTALQTAKENTKDTQWIHGREYMLECMNEYQSVLDYLNSEQVKHEA